MKVLAQIKSFIQDEEGASGIEYALIAAMVAASLAAFVGGTDGLGPKVTQIFKDLTDAMPKKTN